MKDSIFFVVITSCLLLVSGLPASATNYHILEFKDTEDDYGRLADDGVYVSRMDVATSWTVEAWVNPTSDLLSYARVIQRGTNSGHRWLLEYYNSGSYLGCFTFLVNDGSNHFYNTVNDALTFDEWQHVAVICDGLANNIKLYVNGEDKTRASYSAITLPSGVNSSNVFIGSDGYVPGYCWDGFIDEVRCKKEAVPPESLHSDVHDLPYTPDANTAILLHMDEGSGKWTHNAASVSDSMRLGSSTSSDYEPTWRTWFFPADSLPLPVELSSFSATCERNSVVLSWRTESELANLGFNIWRADGGEYAKLNKGIIPGAGDSEVPHDYRYVDSDVLEGVTYFYKLETLDMDGSSFFHGPVEVMVKSDQAAIPESYALSQNYPNPFNPGTTIRYSLPQEGLTQLRVYNTLGQMVKTLVDGDQPAGEHAVYWDGTDDNGRRLSSGIYFYKLQAGDFSAAKKLVFVR